MTKNKKIIIIVGTRAQLIKTAPLIKELCLREAPLRFVFSGQHSETIDDILEEFKIPAPDENLARGFEADTLFKGIKWVMGTLYRFVFKKNLIFGNTDKNSIVITHGDTTTTAIVAFFAKIYGYKVAHLESGLRSFNLLKPFPEELNRLMTFCFSDIYFCPNEWAVNNLKRYKGIKLNTHGNTLIDSLKLSFINIQSSDKSDSYAIVSIHRFENLFSKKRFKMIIEEVIKLSFKMKVKFVLHPVTEKKLKKAEMYNQLMNNDRVELIPRMGYFAFMRLMKNAQMVITDGGSNQEECSYLGIPCLLMRAETERIEGLGDNIVISGFKPDMITAFTENYKKYKKPMSESSQSPSRLISDFLIKSLDGKD